MPRHSAFRFAVPIGAALAVFCGASLWAQTTPAPPSGLRLSIDDTSQEAPWMKKARRPRPPAPGVILKFGNGPGWGAGKTGFNSINVPIRRSRSRDAGPGAAGATGMGATSRERATKAAAKPPGLPPPPPRPSNAARTRQAQTAAAAQPSKPSLAQATQPGAATPPDATGVVPPSDAVTLPVPVVVPQRARPVAPDDDPFGPTGIHAGTFLLRPAIELMSGYDTNPARATVAKGSTAFIAAPELLGKSDWERHQLDIAIRGSYSYFPEVRFADRPNLDARADGRIDVTKDTRIDVEGRYLLGTDYPGSPNVVAAGLARLPVFTDVGATVGVGQKFNRLDVSLKGTIDQIQWQDSVLTDGSRQGNADRDYNQYGTQLRGTYELTPGVKPFAEVDADTRVHELKLDRTDADRDSDGVAVKAGTAFEFTRKLTGEISVGYLNRFYEGPNLPNIHAPLLDAALIWTATGLTTVKFSSATTVDESVVPDVSGALRHRNNIEVTHALRRWLIGTVRFGYEIDDYIGSFRQDHLYVAAVALAYKLSREFWLKGELREEWLSSNIPNSNYAATIALIGVRLQR